MRQINAKINDSSVLNEFLLLKAINTNKYFLFLKSKLKLLEILNKINRISNKYYLIELFSTSLWGKNIFLISIR